jgi:hypothetical protein
MALLCRKPRPLKKHLEWVLLGKSTMHNASLALPTFTAATVGALSQLVECHCVSCSSVLCYTDNTPSTLTWSAPFMVALMLLR